LQSQLLHDISQLERNRNMPYISSFERKGRAEGLREGLREGRREGRLEGRQDTLRELLIGRFGPLPQATEDRVAKATLSELKAWTKAVMNAATLESVFGRH
jgi:predicted transposase YdaD